MLNMKIGIFLEWNSGARMPFAEAFLEKQSWYAVYGTLKNAMSLVLILFWCLWFLKIIVIV